MSNARNLSVVPTQSLSFKNRIINGAMTINQRAVTSVASGSEVYTLDRWIVGNYFLSGAITVGQSTDAPAGFRNSLQITNGTGESLSASDYGTVRQKIEGHNVADLAWGTASAKAIAISFWVKSSVTGNYSIGLINGALNRSNRTVFTINSANTWEQKTVTFSGDTSGTWATDNGVGLYMDVLFVAGSNQYGTADTWTANTLEGVSGASATWVTSTNATFYITGVQLEKGSTATSFDYRPYGTELALCQRYYWRSSTGQPYARYGQAVATATTQAKATVSVPVQFRAIPSAVEYGGALGLYNGGAVVSVTSVTFDVSQTFINSLNFNTAGGLTSGGAYNAISNNDANAYIGLTAEL